MSGPVKNIISIEDQAGLSSVSTYSEFNNAKKGIADDFKAFLLLAKQQKKGLATGLPQKRALS